MMKSVLLGSALVLTIGTASFAMPLAPEMAEPAPIILASGGCGFAYHRTPFGACAPNGFGYGPRVVRLPPPCPRFYHRDPDPARPICYPNF